MKPKLLSFPKDQSVGEVIEELSKMKDSLKSVVVLGLFEDDSQYLRTSKCDQHDKSFLAMFFFSWLINWFEFSGGGDD